MHHKAFLTISLIFITILTLVACGSEGVRNDGQTVDIQALAKDKPETHGAIVTESDFQITNPLNHEWVAAGKAIYELKCQSCHKLSDERLVGPGWKGITERRTPVWILNMITNTEMMLDQDAEAQKLLELCMVRMPNQNLTLDEARKVLEFQRSNDGEK
jgi:hypothetical protein